MPVRNHITQILYVVYARTSATKRLDFIFHNLGLIYILKVLYLFIVNNRDYTIMLGFCFIV